MTTVALETAEKLLAELLKRARADEEIVIADGQGPDVRLAPVARAGGARGFGLLKGRISASDEDFLGPLTEDEIKRWWGESA